MSTPASIMAFRDIKSHIESSREYVPGEDRDFIMANEVFTLSQRRLNKKLGIEIGRIRLGSINKT